MNLVDTTVLAVLGPPQFGEATGEHGTVSWWSVPVRANCYGQVYDTTITCRTEAEALAIKAGHVWLT